MTLENSIASQIIALEKADLELRQRLLREDKLFDGYNDEMEALHKSNTLKLEKIISKIAYPTIEKVGKKASEAAWLVIQHSISSPAFMKLCAELLQAAVEEKKANPVQLAYLTDRIAVFSDKPQLYGTQFDWNDKNEMTSNPFDNLSKVNERRKAIGLNSLEEQTKLIQQAVAAEREHAPADWEGRQQAYNNWRKEVGWI